MLRRCSKDGSPLRDVSGLDWCPCCQRFVNEHVSDVTGAQLAVFGVVCLLVTIGVAFTIGMLGL